MVKRIRLVSIILVTMLIISIIAPSVYAITNNYHFTSNEDSNIQCEDEFTFRNDCFKRSSFLGCSHLEILSAQVAEASVSWYGEEIDKYEVDYSNNAHNLVNMLQNMGFENVSTNKYYTLEKQENSAGVAVGYKTIKVDDRDYTLLAIIPRSAGYKQEWNGNFTVGDGDIHEGFKAARDEVLRYVKKYIKDNNIQGNLKVWTAGHSRGAAIANMVGGFFAGGGIEYFGNSVSITPEDIYCYTYATPRPIKEGADKNVELCVAANRLEDDYINDTPGEEFIYTKGGKVNTKDEVYGGIRNLISENDIFTMLPPELWKFTHYGKDIAMDHDQITEEAMLKELKELSIFSYNKYINGGSPNTFERKTFDLKTLSIVKDNGNYSAMNMSSFIKEKMNGLIYNAATNKEYVDKDYQETLKAIAGTYGMSMTLFEGDFLEDTSSIIGPLVFSYLAYASERLQVEGKAESETEAVAIALEELLSYFTNEEIDSETFTVDDFIVLFAKYIADNENEPIANVVASGIVSLIPEDYQFILSSFKQFHKDYSPTNDITDEEGVKAIIKACYCGADPDSLLGANFQDPAVVREVITGLVFAVLASDNPELQTVFEMEGHGNFKDFTEAILNMIKKVKDEDGNVIKTYPNLAEMADDKLKEAIDAIFKEPLEKAEGLYGSEYKNKFNTHVDNIKANISKVRTMVLYALLYEGENFNAEKDIKNITTFIGNMSIIPLAHYNEIYLAYAKATRNYDCGYEEHNFEYVCLEGENQELNISDDGKLSFKFNIDYDTFIKEGKIIIDNKEVSRDKYSISKGSTIITFNDEFTKELSVGGHTIKASTDEGDVEVNFKIAQLDKTPEEDNKLPEETKNAEKNETKSDNPKTGDNIVIWINLMVFSIIGMAVTVKLKNKKK